MVSAFAISWRCGPRSICCALVGPSQTICDRQTLRVCSEIVWGHFLHRHRVTCRLAKRYVCAASAFPAFAASPMSSIWTPRGPPNVTHVMVFAFSIDSHETLRTQWFLRISATCFAPFYAECCSSDCPVDVFLFVMHCLSFEISKTSAGVRSDGPLAFPDDFAARLCGQIVLRFCRICRCVNTQ